MAVHEQGDWLQNTEQTLALARTSGTLSPGHNRDVWQQAYADEFTTRYEQTLLGEHQVTWQTALGLLATHGIPLRYSRDGRTVREIHSLSTGLLAIGDPVHAPSGTLVPAIQMSSIAYQPLRRGRSRRTPSLLDKKFWQGIIVETGLAATNTQVLDGKSVEHREIRSGNWLERMDDFVSSGRAIRDELRSMPSLVCWFQPVPLTTANSQPYILRTPLTPSPSQPEVANADDLSTHIDKELAAASDALAPVRELGRTLLLVTGPLRESPAFHRTPQKPSK